MKLVINGCHGGFGMSTKAMKLYAELKGITLYPFRWEYSNNLTMAEITGGKLRDFAASISWEEALKKKRNIMDFVSFSTVPILDDGNINSDCLLYSRDIKRNDPALVQVVEQLGAEASDTCASLKIVEIPDGVSWVIEDYDGLESVAEAHRCWS